VKRRTASLAALTAALTATVFASTVGPAAAAWLAAGDGAGAVRAGQLQPPQASYVAVTSAGSRLNWTAPSSGTVPGGYLVTRNGVPVCTTTGTLCDDENLAPATTYTYLVTSTAGSRWVSATPLVMTATTLAGAFAFSAVTPSPVPAGSKLTFTVSATFGGSMIDSRYTGAHPLTISSSALDAAGSNPSGSAVHATFVAGVAKSITTTVSGSGAQTLTVSDGVRTGSLSITVAPPARGLSTGAQ
jgi:hypothetical protein